MRLHGRLALHGGHELCPPCSGRGYDNLDSVTRLTCTLCGGAGEVPKDTAERFWACIGQPHSYVTRCKAETK